MSVRARRLGGAAWPVAAAIAASVLLPIEGQGQDQGATSPPGASEPSRSQAPPGAGAVAIPEVEVNTAKPKRRAAKQTPAKRTPPATPARQPSPQVPAEIAAALATPPIVERYQLPLKSFSITARQIDETINLKDPEDAVKYMPGLFVRKRNDGVAAHGVFEDLPNE